MKKLLALVLSIVTLLGCMPTASAVNEDVEGTVLIYTSMYQFVIDMMDAKLKEEFPNLVPGNGESFFFYGGTGSLQNKLAGERETGTLGCDMMLVADPSYCLELKEDGWLHSFEFEGAENLRFPYDEEGYWYPVRVSNMVLAYNPALKSPDELPKTFKEFAEDPALKGRISMSNPLTSGTALASIAALSEKYGFEYFDALGANGVMIESGSTAQAKLETGECDVIMILEESILQNRKEKGSQLACIYPEDGNIVIPSAVMIVAEEKSANVNTEACEAIASWLLSEEGQSYIVQGYMHSVLANFPEIPYDSIPSEQVIENDMGVDWVRCYKEITNLRNEFQERVTVE